MSALVTITVSAGDVVGWIVGGAALVAAVYYLASKARSWGRRIRAIAHVVDRELDYNHGGSIKDDVHGIAVTVGKLARDLDDLTQRFDRHLDRRNPL